MENNGKWETWEKSKMEEDVKIAEKFGMGTR